MGGYLIALTEFEGNHATINCLPLPGHVECRGDVIYHTGLRVIGQTEPARRTAVTVVPSS